MLTKGVSKQHLSVLLVRDEWSIFQYLAKLFICLFFDSTITFEGLYYEGNLANTAKGVQNYYSIRDNREE